MAHNSKIDSTIYTIYYGKKCSYKITGLDIPTFSLWGRQEKMIYLQLKSSFRVISKPCASCAQNASINIITASKIATDEEITPVSVIHGYKILH